MLAAATTLPYTPYRFHALKPQTPFSPSFTNRRSFDSLKLRASNVDYPLASKILIKNLPYSVNESELEEEFSSFGQIAEVKVVKDKFTNRSKGYAFIQYTSQSEAMVALENMDQKMFDGRLMQVEITRPENNGNRLYPVASGPPEKKLIQVQDETDCWY